MTFGLLLRREAAVPRQCGAPARRHQAPVPCPKRRRAASASRLASSVRSCSSVTAGPCLRQKGSWCSLVLETSRNRCDFLEVVLPHWRPHPLTPRLSWVTDCHMRLSLIKEVMLGATEEMFAYVRRLRPSAAFVKLVCLFKLAKIAGPCFTK